MDAAAVGSNPVVRSAAARVAEQRILSTASKPAFLGRYADRRTGLWLSNVAVSCRATGNKNGFLCEMWRQPRTPTGTVRFVYRLSAAGAGTFVLAGGAH